MNEKYCNSLCECKIFNPPESRPKGKNTQGTNDEPHQSLSEGQIGIGCGTTVGGLSLSLLHHGNPRQGNIYSAEQHVNIDHLHQGVHNTTTIQCQARLGQPLMHIVPIYVVYVVYRTTLNRLDRNRSSEMSNILERQLYLICCACV